MINLRKIIYALGFLFLVFILVGCQKPHEHAFGEWKVKEFPTEETIGVYERYCSGCEEFEQREMTDDDILNFIYEAIENVSIKTETMDKVDLPSKYEMVSITWRSKNQYLISDDGVVNNRSNRDRETTLVAIFKLGIYEEEAEYKITVLGFTDEEKLAQAKELITFPEIVRGDLTLVTKLDSGVEIFYESSNIDIISNDGKVNLPAEETKVTLKIIYKSGDKTMEETKELTVAKYDPTIKQHQLIEYAKDFDLTNITDFKLENNKLILADGVLEATYTSKEIDTLGFVSLVGSWACISSTQATCELKVSVKVNGQWSEYISYRPWGLGLKNALYGVNYSTVKLVEDEVKITNNQKATAVKYTITLKRDTLEAKSPELSLVSLALEIPGHSFDVKIDGVPNYVHHDVPKLYQNEVPEIGNSICSATSTTMLLKFNGFDFSDKDPQYEHRYIAWIVNDYGNDIFGNWVYNTVTMGGYGLDAYVARMYSLEELVYHLANVGPVALSMKGQMTSDVANYYTAGHLIVATGYQIEEDGSISILSNDPNVKGVACKYSQKVIEQTWRYVAYVYEK